MNKVEFHKGKVKDQFMPTENMFGKQKTRERIVSNGEELL